MGNLWAVITSHGCCRAWVTDANGDEETTKQFFLAEKLPPGWINFPGSQVRRAVAIRHHETPARISLLNGDNRHCRSVSASQRIAIR